MSNMLVVRTLGNVTVAKGHGAEPLALCPQEQALLAYLVYENCAVSRDLLCDLFWSGYPVEKARRNLRKLLLLARRHLGSFLLTEREQILLNPATTCWVDVVEFQQQLQKADNWGADPSALTTTAAKHLQQAVQLYRGDFLAGLKQPESEIYATWLQQQQDLLYQQAQQAFAHYAAYLTAQGSYTGAAEVWQQWLRSAPYDELAHTQLLTLLASTGQIHKALRHFEQYRQKLAKELAERPGVELTALYEQLRVGFLPEIVVDRQPADQSNESAPIPSAPGHAFAPSKPLTPLIGADDVLAKISKLLQDPAHRLITLVGPGGVGKTHSALTAAQLAPTTYADGSYFVALGPTEAAVSAVAPLPVTPLLTSLAHACQLPVTQEPTLRQQVLHHLHNREILLVLDSFEHALADVLFLQELLRQAPQVTLLVTSRERLHLAGETVVEILPLPIFTGDDKLPQLALRSSGVKVVPPEPSAAVQLFVARARDYVEGFSLTWENLPQICQICHLVGGLPLAIEMAAAWVGHLPCAEIVAALQQDLSLLTHDKRGIPDRHRNIDTLFEQTWAQLTLPHQEGLRQLAGFPGLFNRQQAQQVQGVTLALLKTLTDKSLLRLYKGEQYELQPLLRRWIVQKHLHLDPVLSAPQHSELTCLLARCRDILQAIHREVDASAPASYQLPAWARSLLSPHVRNLAEPVVDPNLSLGPALFAGEGADFLDVPDADERLALFATYEPAPGMAHSRH